MNQNPDDDDRKPAAVERSQHGEEGSAEPAPGNNNLSSTGRASIVARSPETEGLLVRGSEVAESALQNEPEEADKEDWSSLISVVKAESESDRVKRGRVLLRTFMKKDQTRLKGLATKAGVKLSPASTITERLSSTPLDFARLPQAGTVHDILTSFVGKKEVFPKKEARTTRPSYASLSLDQLEAQVRARFEEANPDRRGDRVLHSFTLQYNEVSVAAICNWSTSGKKQNVTKRQKRKLFAVDPRLRKCGICFRWGHYEYECAHQNEENIMQYRKKQRINKQQKRGPSKNQERPEYETVLEDCGGIVIEQRADPQNIAEPAVTPVPSSPRKQRTILDGILIKAGKGKETRAPPVMKGSFVTWFPDGVVKEKAEVAVGIVIHCSASKGSSLVKRVETISSTPGSQCAANGSKQTEWVRNDLLSHVYRRRPEAMSSPRRSPSKRLDEAKAISRQRGGRARAPL